MFCWLKNVKIQLDPSLLDELRIDGTFWPLISLLYYERPCLDDPKKKENPCVLQLIVALLMVVCTYPTSGGANIVCT